MGKKTAQRSGRRRWPFWGFFALVLGVGGYFTFSDRTPDWAPIYQDLVAAGQCERAFELLLDASSADPRAHLLMAENYETGLCDSLIDPEVAASYRKSALTMQVTQRSDPGFFGRQLDRLSGVLNRREFRPKGLGNAFEWRDTWLWASCVERFTTVTHNKERLRIAIAKAQGHPFKRPTRFERAEARCADKTLAFAKDLERGDYGKDGQTEAEQWYLTASIIGSQEARYILSTGRLEGRFPLRPILLEGQTEEEALEEARVFELRGVVILALSGYEPATLKATALLLENEPGAFNSQRSQVELYQQALYLLLRMETRDAETDTLIAKAKSLLTENQQAEVFESISRNAKPLE